MSIDTDIKCVSCERELIYSLPHEDDDTTTKARIDSGLYKCIPCTKEAAQKRKDEQEKKKEAKKEKQQQIKKLHESKTNSFERKWKDVDENGNPLNTVIEGKRLTALLPEVRIMEIFKLYDIRNAPDGYLSYEMSNVIRGEQIAEIILTSQRQEQEMNNTIHDRLLTREEGESRLKEIEANKRAAIKRQIASIERLISLANKEYGKESVPLVARERLVTKPGYRDPQGNKAPRYFLLSDKDTYEERSNARDKRIGILNEVDKLEEQIYTKNQKHFDEITGQVTE